MVVEKQVDHSQSGMYSSGLTREEMRARWTEEAPIWAASWGISTEEYLKRADALIEHIRKRKKIYAGRECLIRHPAVNLKEYNEAFSAQYGKVFTIDDVHLFSLRR